MTKTIKNFKKIFLVLLIFIAIYFLTLYFNNYPNYVSQKNTPADTVFSGHSAWFDPWDINVYFSAIRSGQHHGILLNNQYTTATNPRVIFYPLYTLSGAIFHSFNPISIYASLTDVTIFIFLAALFFSSYSFLKRSSFSLFALLLYSSLAGLGGILGNIYKSPDLYLTSITFLSAFQRPHEAIGTALYILAMVFLYLYFKEKKLMYQVYGCIANVFLLFFYPYYYVPFLLVFLTMVLIEKKNIRKELLLFFVNFLFLSLLAGIYYFYLQHSGFSEQSSELQPKLSPLDLLTSYGILIPIFFYSVIRIRRVKKDLPELYLIIWTLFAVCISYLPLGYSRFFLRGLYFPLIMIAVLLIRDLINEKTCFLRNLNILVIISIFFILQFFTTFYIFNQRLSNKNSTNFWFYFPLEYTKAFSYLNTLPSGGVLAEYGTSNIVPVYTDDSVYSGHTVQTPNFDANEKLVKQFYSSSMTNQKAKNFLLRNNITYIIYGFEESQDGQIHYPFLKLIYSNTKIAIFTFVS